MKQIDMRSDTVTRPSHGMLEAMLKAEVGDDVYGEDPTVNALQTSMANLFGKDAALFVPSGTMGNEIAIKSHTNPGEEIIVDADSHIFVYETGGPSLLAGVQMRTLTGDRGRWNPEELEMAIRGDAYYLPKTALICLENTHGRSGGSIIPIENIRALRAVSKAKGVPMHLDGARIWNASVSSGIPVKEYAAEFDSVSACFSKGLGAPIGSILVGSGDFIERSRKYRKIFGGGMRQAGILAGAAIYAVEHNFGLLKEDHRKAKRFAEELQLLARVTLTPAEVQSNMVIFEIGDMTQGEVINLLKSKGLLMTPERSSAIRAVMHLDVSMDEVETAAKIMKSLFS